MSRHQNDRRRLLVDVDRASTAVRIPVFDEAGLCATVATNRTLPVNSPVPDSQSMSATVVALSTELSGHLRFPPGFISAK